MSILLIVCVIFAAVVVAAAAGYLLYAMVRVAWNLIVTSSIRHEDTGFYRTAPGIAGIMGWVLFILAVFIFAIGSIG